WLRIPVGTKSEKRKYVIPDVSRNVRGAHCSTTRSPPARRRDCAGEHVPTVRHKSTTALREAVVLHSGLGALQKTRKFEVLVLFALSTSMIFRADSSHQAA